MPEANEPLPVHEEAPRAKLTEEKRLWWRNKLGLVIWLSMVYFAAAFGSRYMPDAWYAALKKPSFNPPNSVFGPVWSLLYTLMGISAWLVWRKWNWTGAGPALVMFLVQLGLNAAWSMLFFGQHRIGAALVDIGLLWICLVITIVLFWQKHRVASGLLWPYLAWVSFAALLNWEFWRLNS